LIVVERGHMETDDIRARLPDDFSRDLLNGACRALEDKANPVRLHLFATAIRELFNHTLHHLAPDDRVRGCGWYVQDQNTDGPTRRQRVMYAVHGGISPEYATDELHLEIDDMCGGVVEAIGTLNRLTHVRPDTHIRDDQAIDAHAEATVEALRGFLLDIERSRSAVANAVETQVHDGVFDALIAETLPELDELASHYSIEESQVEAVHVDAIDDTEIHYTVKANVTVGLQWGSNSDIRNDMGAVGEEDFSVELRFKAPVDDPRAVAIDEEHPVAVDTSSWWEGFYDDDDMDATDRN
jgi:hypothetical protein